MNLRRTEGAFVDLIWYIRRHICQTWMEARMPGSLQVRNLEDDLIVRLKRRAARHGRSTEAEHREILRQTLASEVEPSFRELAAQLRKMTKNRKHTPTEELQREGRDER